jgi:hypothetical protein
VQGNLRVHHDGLGIIGLFRRDFAPMWNPDPAAFPITSLGLLATKKRAGDGLRAAVAKQVTGHNDFLSS